MTLAFLTCLVVNLNGQCGFVSQTFSVICKQTIYIQGKKRGGRCDQRQQVIEPVTGQLCTDLCQFSV